MSTVEKLRNRRVFVLIVLSVGLGGVFWWLLRAGGLPLVPSEQAIRRVGFGGVLGYSALWLVTMFLKAYRWRYQLELLAPVPLIRVLSASAASFAAQLLLPLKTGEFARPALISRGSSISFMAAMSTSATERIVDVLLASAILMVSLLNADVLSPLPERIGNLPVPAKIVPTLGYIAAVASLAAITLVGLFYSFREGAQRFISLTVGRFSPKFGAQLESKLSDLAQGFKLIASPRQALKYLLASCFYWWVLIFGILFLLRSSGFTDATWSHAGVLAGLLAFSFALPNPPGFFGTFQVSVYGALAVFYPADVVQDLGATAVFWLYVLQFGWVFALAPIAFWVEQREVSRAKGAPLPG